MRKLLTFFLFLAFLFQTQAQTWTNYIKQSQVNDFLEEEDQIWVATDAGIFIIQKADYSVEHLTKFNSDLPSNQIERIKKHPQTGQLFIGTYDVGLAMKEPNGWLSIPYAAELFEDQYPLTYCFEWDVHGRLWVGTNEGLLRYENENWEAIPQEGPTEFLFHVWEMEKDLDDNLYLAGNTLVKVAEDSLTLLTPVDFGAEGLFSYGDAHLKVQENGVVWYFTDIGNVGRFEGDSLKVFSSFNSEDNIAFNHIEFVKEDTAGNIWAYLGDHYQFYRYDTTWQSVSFGEEVAEDQVLGLHFMEEGGQPLFIYEREAQFGSTETEKIELADYPFEGPLSNFQYDHEGQLWIKDGYSHLMNLDNDESIFITHEEEPLFSSDYAFGSDGSLWLISGQRVFHQAGDTWEIYDHNNSNLPQGSTFRHIAAGTDGTIWIRVYDKGIYWFNGQEWDKYYLPLPVEGYVTSMVAGKGGDVWFAFWDEYTGNNIVRVNEADYDIYKQHEFGVENLYVRELFYEQENDKLWLLTAEGYVFTFENDAWERISDELDIPEMAVLSGMIVKNGLLVLHSVREFAIYNDGNWTLFDAQNAPIDGNTIGDIGLTETGDLWIGHYGQRAAVEIYQTGLVNSTEGVAQLDIKIRLSPNPVKDMLRVSMENELGAELVNLTVFDANGRIVKQLKTNGFALQTGLDVTVDKIPSGICYLEVSANQLKVSKGFLKYE